MRAGSVSVSVAAAEDGREGGGGGRPHSLLCGPLALVVGVGGKRTASWRLMDVRGSDKDLCDESRFLVTHTNQNISKKQR